MYIYDILQNHRLSILIVSPRMLRALAYNLEGVQDPPAHSMQIDNVCSSLAHRAPQGPPMQDTSKNFGLSYHTYKDPLVTPKEPSRTLQTPKG